ncbi:MAG TPA: cell envelope integrity protein CreD [Accumulibacter sp.]|jgi:inner membrane protein|nr:cell envelope integrity protein CreD [Accumulibacter sp.]HQC80703.1 cell envelope integrity protein CreD [Accumulibacter sp.]
MNKALAYKLLTLILLALVLAFAVMKVEWKVQERAAMRDGAVRDIADQSAHAQQLVGPLLLISCSERREVVDTDDKGKTRRRQMRQDCSRLIRPAQINGQGSLNVTELHRGIYKARVYLATLGVHAVLPAFQPKPGQTLEGVNLLFGVSDPRGLKSIALGTASGQTLDARPGVPGEVFEHGFHVPLNPALLEKGLTLDAKLELAGSGRLDWVPLAEDNDFSLRSAWPHPSFDGQFLPETRTVAADGFSARWRVNDFATGGDRLLNGKTGGWRESAFGVSLIDPVDAYTQTDRAVRYGFLFVLLTLGGFFLFELLKQRPVHPLQYSLIGFAVVLFFLLLLALSEHTGFPLAYLIAAVACVAMITGYSRTLLGSWKGAASLAGGYGLLYLGLYKLLASEDYALLMGAWLIFGVLALTMYLTRRLDWRKAGLPIATASTTAAND